METLRLPSASIVELTERSFYHCEFIKNIDLKNNLISSIDDNTFARSSSLINLDLDGNQITQLSDNHFTHLINLETLRLAYNSNLQLAENAFRFSTNLRDIRLNHCSMSQWRAGWFWNLHNIERVIINDNLITSIPIAAFHNESSLIEIDVSYNNLDEINRMSFGKLDTLTIFSARENQIFVLDHTFFDEATFLNNVLLHGNPCGGRDIFDFQSNKEDYMAELENCFNSFSDGPWGELKKF